MISFTTPELLAIKDLLERSIESSAEVLDHHEEYYPNSVVVKVVRPRHDLHCKILKTVEECLNGTGTESAP